MVRPVTHLQRRLQQLVYPGDLLAERQVLLQTHGRRSPRLREVCADKRIRVLQELDPADDGGHGRVTATQLRLKVCVNPFSAVRDSESGPSGPAAQVRTGEAAADKDKYIRCHPSK